MGLLDILRGKTGADAEDRGQWSDVPMGLRLMSVGNIMSSLAAGQTPNMGGFAAAMQDARSQGAAGRKQRKEEEKKQRLIESYAKKLETTNPEMAEAIRSGQIDPADFLKTKMQNEFAREQYTWQQGADDKAAKERYMWEAGQKEEAARRAREADPSYQILQSLFAQPGGAGEAQGGQVAMPGPGATSQP
ncbi:MAG: hypothetical protein ACRC1H_02855, partial [Caldilineaceae bacterium]